MYAMHSDALAAARPHHLGSAALGLPVYPLLRTGAPSAPSANRAIQLNKETVPQESAGPERRRKHAGRHENAADHRQLKQLQLQAVQMEFDRVRQQPERQDDPDCGALLAGKAGHEPDHETKSRLTAPSVDEQVEVRCIDPTVAQKTTAIEEGWRVGLGGGDESEEQGER